MMSPCLKKCPKAGNACSKAQQGFRSLRITQIQSGSGESLPAGFGGVDNMSTSLVVSASFRVSLLLIILTLSSLVSVHPAKAQNTAIHFIDSQPVPVSNFCTQTYGVYGSSGSYRVI